MQTTLLAAAIALILALVAALVGPLLIDWGTYRPLFEAEAGRLVGLDVTVKGDIEARLLPLPQLTLHEIEIGRGAGTVKAKSLNVELALGPLLRGEWRATELRLVGPELRLGLDAQGHVAAPSLAIGFRPDALTIDRLSVQDGRITLTDAANGGSVTLDRLYFNGDAASLLGPFRGEGDVVVGDAHYPYRISTSRIGDDGAIKLKLNVDPRDRPLALETGGTLVFKSGIPHFDGTLNLTRPAGIRAPSGVELGEPWHLQAKVKANAASALMQDIDFRYGAQDRDIKLTGVAELHFGKAPHFQGVFSGRQVDLDGVLGGADRSSPAAAMRKLAELARGAFRPVIPIQIGLGIDQVTLARGVLANVRGDISADSRGWDLKTFEFRAPGFTQARLTGHLAIGAAGVTFVGPAEIDSSDPKALAAWLQGANEPGKSEPHNLRVHGNLTVGAEKIAVENLTAEFAHETVTGRFAYVFAAGGHPSRLEAVLNATELDLDGTFGFGRALLAGVPFEWPHDAAIAVDIGSATVAGIEGRNLVARVKLDADRLLIDRLSIADLGGAALSASGDLSLAGAAPQGDFRLDIHASDMTPATALFARFAPATAAAFGRSATMMVPATLHTHLTIGANGSANEAKLSLGGSLGNVKVALNGSGDVDARQLRLGAVAVDGKLVAEDGRALIALLGLDSALAVGSGPGVLTLTAKGPPLGTLNLDGRLVAHGLDVAAGGTVKLAADPREAELSVNIAKADLAPLRSGHVLPVSLRTKLVLAGKDLSFRNIEASVAGSMLRGHLAVTSAEPRRVQGEIEADRLDAPMLIAAAVGAPLSVDAKNAAWIWPKGPFIGGLFGDYAGTLTIKARQVSLLPRVEAREFRAALRFGKNEFAIEDAKAAMSGGALAADLTFKSADRGLSAKGKITLADADIAPLLPAAARPPVAGKLNLTLALEGIGLSPVALVGSLQGSGKLSLEDAELAALDPRAFDTVTRAVDQGIPVDGERISDMVRKALDSGHLSIKHGEGAITVAAGQVGIADFSAAAPDADLSLSASFDLIDGLLDAHLALSGKSSGIRPDIFMAIKGPLAAPERSVDVSALTGWLTLRAVENETKRLKAIEAAPMHAVPPPRPPGAKSDLDPPKAAPPVTKHMPVPAIKREAVQPPLQLTPQQKRATHTPPIEVNNLPPPVSGATPDVSSRPQR